MTVEPYSGDRDGFEGLMARVSTEPADCSWEAPLAGTADQVAKQVSFIAALSAWTKVQAT